ncbi:MAG: YihY/virulence factor BrkB family protein [Aeromicrobium sp.]
MSRVDNFQREHKAFGFPLAVVYKYFDDQGAYLAAIITYYAFIAIFPLLLMASSVLGFFLQGNPDLSDRLLNSALSQFPIIGDQLGRPEGLSGSTTAIVVGAIAATYGAMGLGQACQNAANVAWSVPRNSRANPILMRLRSLIFLATAGLGILAVAIMTSLLANPESLGAGAASMYGWLIRIAGLLLNVMIFVVLFQVVSVGRTGVRSVFPGAFASAVMWQLLQVVGNSYVKNVITQANQMNQTFALVLGLFAFIYVAAVMGVLGLELNVVLRRKLYPRALLTPFTDNVSLTRADQRAYSGYAKSQRHKGFQSVEVTFEDRKKKAAPPVEAPPENPPK